jgi:hypothetical protein
MEKDFLYCENCEGGMYTFDIGPNGEGLSSLYHWMRGDCAEEDQHMLDWMKDARPGDYYDHRLGILFCVNLQ